MSSLGKLRKKSKIASPTEQEVITLRKVVRQESLRDWLILRLITEYDFKVGEVIGTSYKRSKLPGIQIEDIEDDRIYVRLAHSTERTWRSVSRDLVRNLRDFASPRTRGKLFENVFERWAGKSDPTTAFRYRLQKYAKEARIIGYLRTEDLRQTVDPLHVKLADFDPYITAQAQRMIPYFALNFSLERTVRRLVSETLKKKYDEGWWETKVPPDVRKEVARRQAEDKESPTVIRSIDKLDYTTFPELRKTIEANWADFEGQFPRGQIQDMLDILRDLGYGRILIAHSCEMPDEEKQRFDLRVGDWFRMISLETNE